MKINCFSTPLSPVSGFNKPHIILLCIYTVTVHPLTNPSPSNPPAQKQILPFHTPILPDLEGLHIPFPFPRSPIINALPQNPSFPISPGALWVFKTCSTWYHFISSAGCLRKLNYRINHTEGQVETSLQVLHACMNIFHFWLTQYVTTSVWLKVKREKKQDEEKNYKKIHSLKLMYNWCQCYSAWKEDKRV